MVGGPLLSVTGRICEACQRNSLRQSLDALAARPEVADPVLREKVRHRNRANVLAVDFTGRNRWIKALDRFAIRGGPPVLITGPAGVGKSALIAAWLDSARDTNELALSVNWKDRLFHRSRYGVIYQTNRARESKSYKVVNRSEHDRVVLIEHPYRPEFALVSKTKYAERARDVYRFEVKVPAGKDATLDVVEERNAVSTVQINNAADNTIRFFLSQKITSEKVKQALEHAQQLKAKRSSHRAQPEPGACGVEGDHGRSGAHSAEPTEETLHERIKVVERTLYPATLAGGAG